MAVAVTAEEIAVLLKRPTLSPEEATRVLPLSRNGMYEAIRRGDIESVRIGRKILIPTAALRRRLGMDAT